MTEPTWILGDCIEKMKSLPANSIDIVVTSPPYNIDMGYSTHDDDMDHGDYLVWSSDWIEQVVRVLKTGGSFFLNVSGSRSEPDIPLHVYNAARNQNPELVLQNEISWVKSIYIDPDDYADSVAQSIQKNITSEEIGDVLGATLTTLANYLEPDVKKAVKQVVRLLREGALEQSQAEQVARRLVGSISKIVKEDRSKEVPFPFGTEKYTDPAIWEYHRRQRGHTFGHVKPIQSNYFLNGTHEFIFHFVKPIIGVNKNGDEEVVLPDSYRPIRRQDPGVGVPFVHPSNYCRWKGVAQGKAAKKRAEVLVDPELTEEQRAKELEKVAAWEEEISQREQRFNKCGGNTWHIRYDTIQKNLEERGGHPATFPIGLPERCIRLHGVEDGMKVLDPFGGIGTTALACKKLMTETKRSLACTIIELDPDYLEKAQGFYQKTSFEPPPQQLQMAFPLDDAVEDGGEVEPAA